MLINHKQALIIFWSLASITGIGWGFAFFDMGANPHFLADKPELLQFAFYSSMMFIPLILLGPIIGSGYFHRFDKVLTNGRES